MRIKEKKGYKRCQNIRGVINEQAQINAFLKKVLNHHCARLSCIRVKCGSQLYYPRSDLRRRFY